MWGLNAAPIPSTRHHMYVPILNLTTTHTHVVADFQKHHLVNIQK